MCHGEIELKKKTVEKLNKILSILRNNFFYHGRNLNIKT